jgi:hypothetical protein
MTTEIATTPAQNLPNVSALLSRISDPTDPRGQFLAEGFDLAPYSVDPTRGEFRLWVNFWNTTDRDTGLMLLLSALSSDWYEVQMQSSNLLRVSEIELILVPVEREDNLLTEDARQYDRDGMQIAAGGIEIELRQDPDGMQWVRIGSTVHDAEECLVNVTSHKVDHLPSGHQFRW